MSDSFIIRYSSPFILTSVPDHFPNKILSPLNKSLFVESNPSPVKYAASLLGLSTDDVRLPLVRVTESTKVIIKDALHQAKLI